MKKTFVDLFCGCGGLSLGIENAGFSLTFASDIDPVCAETFIKNRNLDRARMYIGDIADLNSQYERFSNYFNNVDLVCGGPPCQGFSMANRQRLINDPRNNLYKQYLLFLQNVKPKFFIMENVKGMLNKIEEILNDMQTYLGEEYNISFSIFNAKNFGVPQNRERLIVIGNRIGIESENIIKNIQQRTLTLPKFTLFDAISDLPELRPNRTKNNNKEENIDIGFSSTPYTYQQTPFYLFLNGHRAINFLYNHKNRYNNDRDIEIFTRLPQGANSLHESIADIMPYKSRNGIFKDKYYKFVWTNRNNSVVYNSLCN